MIVYGKAKKKARSQAARSVEGSAQLIQELTAKLSKKTEPTKKNEKGRKFGCVLVYRYTKEGNINELRHNSMYGYENKRNSLVYRYTRTAPKIQTRIV